MSQFRPPVVLEAIESRHKSPRWSAAELVAHASDHCVRAALILLSRCWSFRKATRGRGVRRSARRAVHRSAREIVSAESAVRYRWAFSRRLAFADCPPGEGRFELQTFISCSTSPRFRASAWRTKGTGEIRSRAEPRANKFSPARMLLFARNSAPNSGRIPPREALAAPGVRIHPAPPTSQYEPTPSSGIKTKVQPTADGAGDGAGHLVLDNEGQAFKQTL